MKIFFKNFFPYLWHVLERDHTVKAKNVLLVSFAFFVVVLTIVLIVSTILGVYIATK